MLQDVTALIKKSHSLPYLGLLELHEKENHSLFIHIHIDSLPYLGAIFPLFCNILLGYPDIIIMTSKQSRTEFVDEHSQQPPFEDEYYESEEEEMADEAAAMPNVHKMVNENKALINSTETTAPNQGKPKASKKGKNNMKRRDFYPNKLYIFGKGI